MLFFCGNPRQHDIVCWPRSPGDHALAIEQFKIEGFNESKENIDELVAKFIALEDKENDSVKNLSLNKPGYYKKIFRAMIAMKMIPKK